MGLGTYLGYFVSQNGKGHVLGHVKDLGDDAKKIDRVRIYRTNARYAAAIAEGIFSVLLMLTVPKSILPHRRFRPCRPSLYSTSSGRGRI